MHESLNRGAINASSPKERLFRQNRFGTIVRALWPTKPALHLSQLDGKTERGAQLTISGERKPSARDVEVIIHEALRCD